MNKIATAVLDDAIAKGRAMIGDKSTMVGAGLGALHLGTMGSLTGYLTGGVQGALTGGALGVGSGAAIGGYAGHHLGKGLVKAVDTGKKLVEAEVAGRKKEFVGQTAMLIGSDLAVGGLAGILGGHVAAKTTNKRYDRDKRASVFDIMKSAADKAEKKPAKKAKAKAKPEMLSDAKITKFMSPAGKMSDISEPVAGHSVAQVYNAARQTEQASAKGKK